MANTQLFQSTKGALAPRTDTRNHQQAPAYAMSPRHQLAQLAATGCLSQTFYASAEAQLDTVLELAMSIVIAFSMRSSASNRMSSADISPSIE